MTALAVDVERSSPLNNKKKIAHLINNRIFAPNLIRNKMEQKQYPYSKFALSVQLSDNSIFPWASALVYKSPVDGRLTSMRYTLHSALDLNFNDKETVIRSILNYAKVNQFYNREYIYSIIRIDHKSLYSIESFVITKYSVTLVDGDSTRSLIVKEV